MDARYADILAIEQVKAPIAIESAVSCLANSLTRKVKIGKSDISGHDQFSSIRNRVRSLSAIHLGGLPRPVQVAPVSGSRYLGLMGDFTCDTAIRRSVPKMSDGVIW